MSSAGWITHPENRRFERAITNRVWGLMFGRPWSDPVDDLPSPGDEDDILDVIGKDFRLNGYSLHRLIRTIAGTRAFQMSSEYPTADDDEFYALQEEWAVFPMVRLRPEQVIGSMLQAAYVRTIDQNSHLFVRMTRFFNERDERSEGRVHFFYLRDVPCHEVAHPVEPTEGALEPRVVFLEARRRAQRYGG